MKMKTTSPWTACVGDGREGRRRSKSGGLTAVRRFVFDPHDTLESWLLKSRRSLRFSTRRYQASSFKPSGPVRQMCGIVRQASAEPALPPVRPHRLVSPSSASITVLDVKHGDSFPGILPESGSYSPLRSDGSRRLFLYLCGVIRIEVTDLAFIDRSGLTGSSRYEHPLYLGKTGIESNPRSYHRFPSLHV